MKSGKWNWLNLPECTITASKRYKLRGNMPPNVYELNDSLPPPPFN